MIMSVTTSMVLRPTRSPKCPKIAAPKGRAKNPTAYVPKAPMVLSARSDSGKYSLLKTSALAVPWIRKSTTRPPYRRCSRQRSASSCSFAHPAFGQRDTPHNAHDVPSVRCPRAVIQTLDVLAKKMPGYVLRSNFRNCQIGSDTSRLASIERLDRISTPNHARLLDHTIKARSIV